MRIKPLNYRDLTNVGIVLRRIVLLIMAAMAFAVSATAQCVILTIDSSRKIPRGQSVAIYPLAEAPNLKYSSKQAADRDVPNGPNGLGHTISGYLAKELALTGQFSSVTVAAEQQPVAADIIVEGAIYSAQHTRGFNPLFLTGDAGLGFTGAIRFRDSDQPVLRFECEAAKEGSGFASAEKLIRDLAGRASANLGSLLLQALRSDSPLTPGPSTLRVEPDEVLPWWPHVVPVNWLEYSSKLRSLPRSPLGCASARSKLDKTGTVIAVLARPEALRMSLARFAPRSSQMVPVANAPQSLDEAREFLQNATSPLPFFVVQVWFAKEGIVRWDRAEISSKTTAAWGVDTLVPKQVFHPSPYAVRNYVPTSPGSKRHRLTTWVYNSVLFTFPMPAEPAKVVELNTVLDGRTVQVQLDVGACDLTR